jgi:hypothetical protein
VDEVKFVEKKDQKTNYIVNPEEVEMTKFNTEKIESSEVIV